MKKSASLRVLRERAKNLHAKNRKQACELRRLVEENQSLRLEITILRGQTVPEKVSFSVPVATMTGKPDVRPQPRLFDPIRDLQTVVAREFGLTVSVIETPGTKKGDTGLARQLVMHFCLRFRLCGKQVAAEAAGRTSHATAIAADKTVRNRLAVEHHGIFRRHYDNVFAEMERLLAGTATAVAA